MTKSESTVVETKSARVWLGEDGIVRFSYVNPVVRLTEAKEILDAVSKISGGIQRPICIDSSQLISMNREARIYLTSEKAHQVTLAAGIVWSTPVSKMIGTLVMRLNKPPYPMRNFPNEAEAIEWLKSFVQPSQADAHNEPYES